MSDLPPVSPASPATVPGTPTTVLREETAFKDALDPEVPSELVRGLVEAAGETFDAVTAIATALWERENPPPVT
ncbi:MAG TPA: hypothetical protein VEI47_08525 [Gemmatimonadales bacterium]|nr:hypothetical protein [Gemmatimonadales bacterium]